MSKFQMYKITIKNWSKHQGSLKKGHSHFLFSKRFFDDSKITMLSAGTTLTYIWLLTVCSDCGGGELRDTFECHGGQMPHTLRTGGGRLEERLEQLQSFQLLTYEKINPLYNRIEKNRKEEKRKEKNLNLPQKVEKSDPQKDTEKSENKLIWEEYVNAYRLRWGVDPIRNAQVNSQISSLRKKLGLADALAVIRFYLTHNDQFYVKKTHSFGLCLKDAETLRTQMIKNIYITNASLKKFERKLEEIENDKMIENLWSSENDV